MPRIAPARPAEGPYTRVLAGLAFAAAAVLLLGVPLAGDAEALEPFRGPKQEVALAAWAVLAAVFVVSNLRGKAWRDPWWVAWGGVLAGGAASTLGSGQPGRVLGNLIPIALAALGWGALRQLSEARREILARLVVWAGVIEALLVLLFLNPSWQPLGFSNLTVQGERYAWIGTLGNPADVGVFLLLPALIAGHHALTVRRHRPASLLAALLMIAVLLGTRTLTSTAALAAGGLVLLWRTAPRRRRLPLIGGVAAVVLVLFLATPLRGRVSAAVNEARLAGWHWLGSGRAASYSAAASMIAAKPLTGVGFGLYEANSFRFQSLDVLADRGRVLGLETSFGEAHNELLQYGAETGLVGLLFAGAGIAWAVRRRPRGKTVLDDVWVLGTAAFLLTFAQFPLHLSVIATQWAIVAALLVPPLPSPPAPDRGTAQVRLLVAGVLAGLAGTVAWQRYGAGVAMGQTKVLTTSLRGGAEPAATRAEVARAALAHLLPRARWLSESWEARIVVGNLAVEAGDRALAVESFGTALALADRPEVRFDVGMALLLSGDTQAGIADLVRAVQLNPAIFREIKDAELSRTVRRRLDALGYGTKHPWIYRDTPAANP